MLVMHSAMISMDLRVLIRLFLDGPPLRAVSRKGKWLRYSNIQHAAKLDWREPYLNASLPAVSANLYYSRLKFPTAETIGKAWASIHARAVAAGRAKRCHRSSRV